MGARTVICKNYDPGSQPETKTDRSPFSNTLIQSRFILFGAGFFDDLIGRRQHLLGTTQTDPYQFTKIL